MTNVIPTTGLPTHDATSPKRSHDAVAEHLIHRALEATHGVYHMVQSRIEELLGGFGTETTDEFRRVLEVGKQHASLCHTCTQRT